MHVYSNRPAGAVRLLATVRMPWIQPGVAHDDRDQATRCVRGLAAPLIAVAAQSSLLGRGFSVDAHQSGRRRAGLETKVKSLRGRADRGWQWASLDRVSVCVKSRLFNRFPFDLIE